VEEHIFLSLAQFCIDPRFEWKQDLWGQLRMKWPLERDAEGRLLAVLKQWGSNDILRAPFKGNRVPIPQLSMQAGRVLAFICGTLLFLSIAAGAQADSTEVQTLDSYQGQNVSSLDIAGRPDLSLSNLSQAFAQHPGTPFAKEKVSQTIAALKSAGGFTKVRVQVEPEAEGIRVTFVLEPAVYFGIFQFPGAERFAYSHLVQVANYPTETPYSASVVEKDRSLLLAFLQQSGYFQADVKTEVQIDKIHAIANVLFHVTLGRKAKFGVVDIVGASPKDQAAFQTHLISLMARARGVAIRRGKTYNRSTLDKATLYLQSALQKEGMLGVQVKLAGAEYRADANQADIHFTIIPGAMTHVEIAGAHLWPWTKTSLLPIYQGVGVDDDTVEEGKQAILSYFQAKGYFDVHVEATLTDGNTARTVAYRIDKEEKHRVNEVRLTGNAQLKDPDLRSHIAVQKKTLFSHGKYSEQLVRTSLNNLKAVYQSEGFSSVQVTSSVTKQGRDVQVSFNVIEGPRDVVSSFNVVGADTLSSSQYAPTGLKVGVGHPYSQANVENDRAAILANYLKAGYLTASFRETATEQSKDNSHQIAVVYHIHEGPKVLAGDRLTLGRSYTEQRLIDQDVASLRTGQPLTETDLLTAGSKLYDHTGVFDWAEVDPKRDITTQTREDVLVKVHEARRNEFTYGLGFEIIHRGGSIPSGTVVLPNLPPTNLPSNFTTSQVSFYGPRGTAQYTRNNFRGRGESLSVTAFAGRLDQRAAVYYIDPGLFWSHWRATASFSAERNEQNPVFSSQQEIGSYQVQRELDAAKKDLVFFRYSLSKTDLTRLEIPGLVLPEDQHVRLSTLGANFTRDTRDNVLDEHKGLLQSIELDFNSTKLGSSVNFAKLTGQVAYFKQAIHRVVWANSLRLGLAQPYANSRIPLSEEYFSGGGDSLRGFALDGAGPQRQVPVCSGGSSSACACPNTNCSLIQVPSGGNELFILNSEARVPLPFRKGLGLVVFYDGGNVFPDVGFRNFGSLYSNSVGLGLRYSTPVGPIRFDLGRNLNAAPGTSATQYFFTIGQAF